MARLPPPTENIVQNYTGNHDTGQRSAWNDSDENVDSSEHNQLIDDKQTMESCCDNALPEQVALQDDRRNEGHVCTGTGLIGTPPNANLEIGTQCSAGQRPVLDDSTTATDSTQTQPHGDEVHPGDGETCKRNDVEHVLETPASPLADAAVSTSIATCNIRGLKQKLEIVTARSDYITGLQETDVDESKVNSLRKQATELGFTLVFAEPTTLSTRMTTSDMEDVPLC